MGRVISYKKLGIAISTYNPNYSTYNPTVPSKSHDPLSFTFYHTRIRGY